MFNPNIPNTGYRGRPIVIEDDNEDNGGMQVDYAPAQHPQHSFMAYGRVHPIPIPTTTQEPSISVSGPRLTKSTGHNASSARMPSPGYPAWHTTHEQEKKVRSRLREERHAALCVLLDRELLTLQALATQETLPQARRRFLSKLLAPGDPEEAAKIRADRFIIQHPSTTASSSSSSSVPLTVSRGLVDVHETDDGGWRRPDAGSGPGSAVSSPASGSKKRGKETPDRARSKVKVSVSRQQQQQRERERRRRWSGAERDEPGSPSMQRFSP
ncbi:hypothetical protein KXW98_006816 [Aspergillus fumigatus]|uniref:Uncharacterized protein n=1 Tax=Aspergillus fumigatus TaxID=746128 RepID=A0A8H4MUB3_ASPFM|nr:hypothetical protein CNMCM8689_000665 [Aspergillus fumigatus]KAF4293110.1 hypothetical protein CNMCM8686_006550 [Aspergillus fumigatus]KAH1331736.1 hypothetical protein KXX38_006256 [Aspergillus fumigatus]KAH1389111.1 hypothetical protein KXX10_001161 [Aspergillus fumigatus]KAH1389242.1 hypothetical protein KXX50_001230 [Aspergillus fumigatus]